MVFHMLHIKSVNTIVLICVLTQSIDSTHQLLLISCKLETDAKRYGEYFDLRGQSVIGTLVIGNDVIGFTRQ